MTIMVEPHVASIPAPRAVVVIVETGGGGVATADPSERPTGAVKSADRVLTLLEYLAEVKRAPFASIVRDLGLPNSSCHQLLQTVAAQGFIEFDEPTRTFRIGSRLWEVAHEGLVWFGVADGVMVVQLQYKIEDKIATHEEDHQHHP